MGQATFTFRVDDELKAAFSEVARAQDRTAAQLLRVLMRDAIRRQRDGQDYDTWFRGEVEQGLREADDPTVRRVDNEDVKTSWRQQRATLVERVAARKT